MGQNESFMRSLQLPLLFLTFKCFHVLSGDFTWNFWTKQPWITSSFKKKQNKLKTKTAIKFDGGHLVGLNMFIAV